jgi:hypothetical protein
MDYLRYLSVDFVRRIVLAKSKTEGVAKVLMWLFVVFLALPKDYLDTLVPLRLGLFIAIVAASCILVSSAVLAWLAVPTMKIVTDGIRQGDSEGHYSIGLQNTSSLRRVKKPLIEWASSVPPIEHMPIALHQSGDSFKDRQRPDLRQKGTAVFDLIRIDLKTGDWVVMGEYEEKRTIQKNSYSITLVASGEDVSSVTKVVRLEPLADGRARIYLE